MGRLKRKNRESHNRKEKNIILIGAEGDNRTESIYFLSINRHFRKYQIKIADGNKTDPVGIVEDVIKSIKKAGIDINNGDIAACVFDTDFGKTKEKQINNARKLATKHGILIFISNPCFEVWFLEHFCFTSKPFGSCSEVIDSLKKYIPKYSKKKDFIDLLLDKTHNALINCRKLKLYHDNIGNIGINRNPCSEVYAIVEKIVDTA